MDKAKILQQAVALTYEHGEFAPKVLASGKGIVAEQIIARAKENNIYIHDGVTKEEFVDMRTKRDKTLEMPVLILPSIQINIRAGHFPPVEENGVAYLKIPLNLL